MDSTALLQLAGTITVLILVVPGLIYGLRDRRRAKRVIVIGGGMIGFSVLLFLLIVRE